jgi:hypothetical protein
MSPNQRGAKVGLLPRSEAVHLFDPVTGSRLED